MKRMIRVIEANDQRGTMAFYDMDANMRTQWMQIEGDDVIDEIDDAQPEWISADDLMDQNGMINYSVMGVFHR